MNRKKMIKKMLVVGLILLGLGGWLLHCRIHSPVKDADYFIPFISGIISIIGLPLLFWFRPTLNLGYIINGFLVIIGTITMTHFSIVRFWFGLSEAQPLPSGLKDPVNLLNIILNSTLADSIILWGKFAIGKAIFDLEFLKSDTDMIGKGRYFRYPNMGWWWAHLFAVALVYALGNIMWR